MITEQNIQTLTQKQKTYFRSGATLPVAFRLQMLERLMHALQAYEQRLTEALWTDLHKCYQEAYLTEMSILYGEIRHHRRHLRRWASSERKPSPISIWPAKSQVIHEPLGNTLIIAPWNYPVQLLINPLIGAISAGCTAMLKPSPYTPHVAATLSEMIRATFPEEYIAIVEGNREVNQWLLAQRWDLIFFTGSPSLGKMVMEAAAKHLTPVVLELGGKSPCIIDRDANLPVAAKRVAWGKALNAGQTCIAPDYLLVHEEVKEAFLQALVAAWEELLTKKAEQVDYYVRIVNDKAMDRLISYLADGTIYYGGAYDKTTRYMQPTILTEVQTEASVMQEEIFGPIFPVVTFSKTEEAIGFVNEREKPLALYYFGQQGKQVLQHTSSGGACINDVIMHIANGQMPFGGVGQAGMGAYHGKESYLAFTHQRATIHTPTCIDMPFRYMPYKLFAWIKKMV